MAIMQAKTTDFHAGQRVKTAPHTDAWASGDRFGEVVKLGRSLVHVKMDRSDRVRYFHPDNITDASQ